MKINKTDKINILISLGNRTYEETKRYRDHVWKVLIWTIGLIIGTIAMDSDLLKTCSGKWLGSIFISFVAICGIWSICYANIHFVWNRNLLRKCENKMKLYDKGFFGKESVLPEKWKTSRIKFPHKLFHFVQWTLVILIITIFSIYTLWT